MRDLKATSAPYPMWPYQLRRKGLFGLDLIRRFCFQAMNSGIATGDILAESLFWRAGVNRTSAFSRAVATFTIEWVPAGPRKVFLATVDVSRIDDGYQLVPN